MQIPGIFFASIICLVYVLYIGYLPWFNPQEYLRRTQMKRKSMKLPPLFFPAVIANDFFLNHPMLDLWWTRISILLVIIPLLIIVIVSVYNLLASI